MPPCTKTISVGVWGLGAHARRRILPALHACPETSLAGVTTRDQTVAGQEAVKYGCTAWPSPAEMLKDPAVEAVYVATPSGLHTSHGMTVLRSGKHLWCEKPIASTLAEAQELSKAARENDRALCEGLMYLYHPQFSVIANIISADSIGAVLSIQSQFGLPPLEKPGFRTDPTLGGGALLDLAPYPLSATLALLDQRWDVVDSYVGRPSGHAVDISGHALLTTSSGNGTAFLEWGYERAYRNHISVWGERGSIQSDFIFSKPPDFSPTVSLRDQNGRIETIAVAPADSFEAMFSSFTEAVWDPALGEKLRDGIELRAGLLEQFR